jgi:hypothetical protein
MGKGDGRSLGCLTQGSVWAVARIFARMILALSVHRYAAASELVKSPTAACRAGRRQRRELEQSVVIGWVLCSPVCP